MTEPTLHRSPRQSAQDDSINSISDASMVDTTMADVGLQGRMAQSRAEGGAPGSSFDRGMPGLNRRSAGAHSTTSWLMLLIIVVVLAGAVWTVRHLLSMRSQAHGGRRDDASAQQIAGRVFGDDSPQPASGALRTYVASAAVPASASPPAVPSRTSRATAPIHSYYDAPLLAGGDSSGVNAGGISPAVPGEVPGVVSDGMVPGGVLQASSGQGQSTAQTGPLAEVLRSTSTPTAAASFLGDRNFLLTKGTTVDCVLDTALDSTAPGITSCTVTKNIYSDNGHVVLIERGSQVMGEYQSNVHQGQKRIFVLWDRIKTPLGVIVSLDSPAADALGRTGFDGYVDNHWWQRLGAAFMLSTIQDAIGYAASRNGSSTGAIEFNNTQQTGNDEAARVLDSTINIPPTLSKNQGDRVSIYVARDLDFSRVYALQPTGPGRP
jgi:type IV secretion system protein VirB10